MENKINWDRKDYWNEYNIYDEYFISFHLDHVGIDENRWKELVEKWRLSTIVHDEKGDVSVHNENCSIVISGINCNGIPVRYLMLTFNKNVDMSTFIRFFRDFGSVLNNYDDLTIREGFTGEYTDHPKEMLKIMIERL